MLAEYRRDYETRLQSRPNIEAQQARQVVQKARDLIRQSGIGDALTLLLEEVKYWPSWSQRDDLVKSVHFPANDIRAREDEPVPLVSVVDLHPMRWSGPSDRASRGVSFLRCTEPAPHSKAVYKRFVPIDEINSCCRCGLKRPHQEWDLRFYCGGRRRFEFKCDRRLISQPDFGGSVRLYFFARCSASFR
jgi:hypothetical protein